METCRIVALSEKPDGKERCGDHVAHRALDDEGLLALALADGVGSHPCDWLASRLACTATLDAFSQARGDVAARMHEAVLASHSEIQDLRGEAAGALSTLVFAVWNRASGEVRYLGVGDSRIYHLRKRRVTQLTQDDVASVVVRREGRILLSGGSAQLAQGITNALGHRQPPRVEIGSLAFARGEMLALASDGCHALAGFERGLVTCVDAADLEAAARRLLGGRHAAPHPDDATLLLVRRSELAGDDERAARRALARNIDFRSLGLHGHGMIRIVQEALTAGIDGGDPAAVEVCLDYLEEHDLLPRRADLLGCLERIHDDGTARTKRAFDRLLALARKAT